VLQVSKLQYIEYKALKWFTKLSNVLQEVLHFVERLSTVKSLNTSGRFSDTLYFYHDLDHLH